MGRFFLRISNKAGKIIKQARKLDIENSRRCFNPSSKGLRCDATKPSSNYCHWIQAELGIGKSAAIFSSRVQKKTLTLTLKFEPLASPISLQY
ncbi:MAG UNVERIFIED_CONTAM: hypothetical protein LVR29_12870 [Microcystis novacekii LVE1205-3]|jgi:hypothetical protein